MRGTIQGVGRRVFARRAFVGRVFAAGRVFVFGAVLAGAVGCGVSRNPRSPFIAQQDARINIEIVNHNFQNLEVHALWLGRRQRLGTVYGTQTEIYMLPWDTSQEIQIEFDILAVGKCITRQIWADPGDHLFVEVQSHINAVDCVGRAPD